MEIEANWGRESCLKEKDWTQLQLIVDRQECGWVQCGELIHFFKKTWKSRLHVKSPNFYMAVTKKNIKGPLWWPPQFSGSGNCSVKIFFYPSKRWGEGQLVCWWLLNRPIHSAQSSKRLQGSFIQNLSFRAPVSLWALISLFIKWVYKIVYLWVNCQTEYITYWRPVRATCFYLHHLNSHNFYEVNSITPHFTDKKTVAQR